MSLGARQFTAIVGGEGFCPHPNVDYGSWVEPESAGSMSIEEILQRGARQDVCSTELAMLERSGLKLKPDAARNLYDESVKRNLFHRDAHDEFKRVAKAQCVAPEWMTD